MGEPIGLGKVSERVIKGDFGVFVGSETLRFSCGDSGLIVESLDCPEWEELAGLEPVQDEGLVFA